MNLRSISLTPQFSYSETQFIILAKLLLCQNPTSIAYLHFVHHLIFSFNFQFYLIAVFSLYQCSLIRSQILISYDQALLIYVLVYAIIMLVIYLSLDSPPTIYQFSLQVPISTTQSIRSVSKMSDFSPFQPNQLVRADHVPTFPVSHTFGVWVKVRAPFESRIAGDVTLCHAVQIVSILFHHLFLTFHLSFWLLTLPNSVSSSYSLSPSPHWPSSLTSPSLPHKSFSTKRVLPHYVPTFPLSHAEIETHATLSHHRRPLLLTLISNQLPQLP